MNDFENVGKYSELTGYLSTTGVLDKSAFTVIDVGAAGGISEVWKNFGSNLRAIGVDPVVEECSRLQDTTLFFNIKYVPAFIRSKTKVHHTLGNPTERLSAFRLNQHIDDKEI